MRISVPKEIAPHETRVALVPETVGRLVRAGFAVAVESGAGASAGHDDAAYRDAGAEIAADPQTLLAGAAAVLKVRGPRPRPDGGHEADRLPAGALVLGLLDPRGDPDGLERLARAGVSAFALEMVPRISRAQKMDALSAMSTVAGYKAALLGASTLGKFFPLLMTAAGTIAPARVLVIGAGVAGLQAIATSRRLGAVVEATDVRPAVREEVQSLGATFVGLELAESEAVGAGGYAVELSERRQDEERALLGRHVKSADVVLCTAMVPGRPAPRIVTADMVATMRPGSVLVDLAAEQGGNCDLTRPGETVVEHGVTIHGPINLAGAMPQHASQMYSRNVSALLLHLVRDGAPHLDFDDEITRGACVAHEGRVRLEGHVAPLAPEPREG